MTMSNSREFNISIKDFQIIKKASLTFLPGLNCIIGQSNNGKSAILRATKAAIYNTPGTTSVRLGCNSYAVGIQANGHTVIFQKGTNSAYKIDGTTLEKIGRTQIPEVAEALGIKELNLNGSNEEINFLDQMEKPFLLDRSETELFRFIVDSGKDSNVTTALKSLTQDRQQLTRDITTTEGKLELIESQLKQQEENLKFSESKLNLFEEVINLGPRITRSKELTALRSQINSQLEDISNLKGKLTIYNELNSSIDPSIEKINNVLKKQEVLGILSSSISKDSSEKVKLEENLSNLSKVDGAKLEDLINKYSNLGIIIDKINEVKEALDKLKEIKYPEINPEVNDNIERYVKVKGIMDSLINGKSQLDKYKKDLITVEEELSIAEKEINDLGVCPMCGQPLHIGG